MLGTGRTGEGGEEVLMYPFCTPHYTGHVPMNVFTAGLSTRLRIQCGGCLKTLNKISTFIPGWWYACVYIISVGMCEYMYAYDNSTLLVVCVCASVCMCVCVFCVSVCVRVNELAAAPHVLGRW